ncbi:MAG TPA: penicillin acylase family protein [Actinomycetota bacterium]|nr:penicillin acylase family protein [Actinomycetota bacterium]
MMRTLTKSLAALALSATVLVSPVGAADQSDPPVQPYGEGDGAITALNILPPGQGEYQNGPEQAAGTQSPHNTDQIEPYERMVQGAPDIRKADLGQYFKDATFGVKPDDIEREDSPRDGVVVQRDAGFGVPHVYGTTRADVMFGAGYVSAEDRLFMMDTLRHVARGRMSEFLGASEANLASDRAVYRTSAYTEEELAAMIERVEGLHPELGPIAAADLTAYVEGVNQYIDEARTDPRKLPAEYQALQIVPEDWLPTDTVAVASLIGSQLGVGGGDELGNAAFVGALQAKGFSFKQARRILADFNFPNDPESPVTTKKRFVWNTDLGKLDKRSRAFPDDPAAVQEQLNAAVMPDRVDAPWGPIPLRFPDASSNALLVGSKKSSSGRPIAVFGPQVAYWSPQILMELDLHGPGIDARGVGFPGISQYVLLGRGADYAWSATSAGGDQVDTFVEELCDPEGGEATVDSSGYVADDGKCVEIYSRTDTWTAKPSAGGVPPENVVVEMTTERTDSGIIQARGTVGDKPVAFTHLRSSFGKEIDSALTYVEISDPDRIDGAADFRRAFARFTFTFNWFYLDDEQIAFQLGGLHPLRARRTDPDLPVWGTGKWDWRGRLSFAGTPYDVDPKKGWMTSWNNKQAPGFRAHDGNFSYGPVQRVQMLDDGIRKYLKRKAKLSLVDLVNIMGDAATTDLRGTRVLPFMLKVVGKPSEPRLKEAVKLLKEWQRSGAHRRDKDADGSYEHSPAVALMDAWWEPAAQAIFKPVLGDAYDVLPMRHHDEPRAQGSAFQSGFYSHVNKDLRTVLGLRVRGKASRVYCGEGSLKKCREALRASLEAAVAALEEEFGADPATWDADETGDQIDFTPVGLQDQPNMQWQNRPTFQQVLEFGGR